jgi:hypothetical protein
VTNKSHALGGYVIKKKEGYGLFLCVAMGIVGTNSIEGEPHSDI